jgi:hypothetical protein
MNAVLTHTGFKEDLFAMAFRFVTPCNILLDVGCGIRPQNLVRCKRHICIEPHTEYAEILQKNGYEVIQKKANEALDDVEAVDTILALDVIEHMERKEGEIFLKKALEKAKKQIVVFTPLGFMPQEETGVRDSWGLHGQEFQRHRSGWMPEDFDGWKCYVEKKFHHRNNSTYGAFIAVHG